MVVAMIGLMLLVGPSGTFAERQGQAARVRQAQKNVGTTVDALFEGAGVGKNPRKLLLRAFKQEGELEVWGTDPQGRLRRVRTYPVCAPSGTLGPKRQKGDLQVPEGIYHVDRFNAWSNFHLSLGLNYPNRSDRIRGAGHDLGGDIFVHGDCVTIGCIPVEDGPIEEIYLMALGVRLRGGRVDVHVFPARLTDDTLARLKSSYAESQPKSVQLWQELQPFYRAVAEGKKPPKFRIDGSGAYRLQ